VPPAVSGGLGGRLRKSSSGLVSERSEQQEAQDVQTKHRRLPWEITVGEKAELGRQAITPSKISSHRVLFYLLKGYF